MSIALDRTLRSNPTCAFPGRVQAELQSVRGIRADGRPEFRYHSVAVLGMDALDKSSKIVRLRAFWPGQEAPDGPHRVHAVANEVYIPGDDIGGTQNRSKTCFVRDYGCFVAAPLGKQRCESECSQCGSQHRHLGSEQAVCDWLAGVTIAANLVGYRPDDGGTDREYRPRSEYRAAPRAEPEQQWEQECSRRHQRPGSREQSQSKTVRHGQNDDCDRALEQLTPRWRLADGRGYPDQEWGNRYDAQRVRREPDLPHVQKRRCRRAEELHRTRGAEGGNRCGDGSCGEKTKHTPQTVDIEGRTVPALDQPHHHESLARIARAKGESAPDVPVAHESGCDARAYHRHYHWQACPPTKRNQGPGGDPRGGPEYSHAFIGREESKTQLCGQEIGGANCDGNCDAEEPPSRSATYRGIPLDLLDKLLQNVAPPGAVRSRVGFCYIGSSTHRSH